MKRFETVENMVEAAAQNNHKNNLARGGVYRDEKRYSDLNQERRCAAKKVQFQGMTFVTVMKLDVSSTAKGVKMIPRFGYVELR